MKHIPIPRLDKNPVLHDHLLRYCRLERGDIWTDPQEHHRVGCLDATCLSDVESLMDGKQATLAVQDPPYNLVAFDQHEVESYIRWCQEWLKATEVALSDESSLYVWIGADQQNGFQPLPDFMMMMRLSSFQPRSFITMRNQRGYGTQKNWMAVRQELLYYTRGKPVFHVEAEYTDIPKKVRGYYKEINGKQTENLERGKSDTLRAGNVWVDIQQVFYRMEENVNGCYAQKPLKSCQRIIAASSNQGDVVVDFFCHSGSTLLAADMLKRQCSTMDSDPVYCEIAIRRLERFRETGKTGWQNGNPFEEEMHADARLREMAGIVSDQHPNDIQPRLFEP